MAALPKLKIEVTSKHIKKGVKQDAESCPIALAIRGLKLRNVEVGGDDVDYTKGGKKFQAILPQRARNFVASFDIGKEVKPFSFTLAPYEIDENGLKVDQRKAKTSKSKTPKTKVTTSPVGDSEFDEYDDFDC
jgi:hypothetical protein